MSKRTIIFQEHKKITIKEIDELFYFTILYYDKWSSRKIIKQSEGKHSIDIIKNNEDIISSLKI